MSISYLVDRMRGHVDSPLNDAEPPSMPPDTERPLRLRLSTSIGHGVLDGAWWPYTRDLAREAVDLVDHFPAAVASLSRLLYSTPDWDKGSPRRVKAARIFVNLGSFPHDDTHKIMARTADGGLNHRVLHLLVVPPEWDERAAAHVMRIAAQPTNLKSAAAILSESEDLPRAHLLSHWDDDGRSESLS
jgi:hypothetical protein